MAEEQFRPSGWLKTALIADRVVDDLTPTADQYLEKPPSDKWECREALARQLSIHGYDADVDDTLDYLLTELQELLKGQWPPVFTTESCDEMAERSIRGMSPVGVYSMLRAGPESWRKNSLKADTSVDGLSKPLKHILVRSLSSELNRMLERWTNWNIPKLITERKEAIKASEGRAGAMPDAATTKEPRKKPNLDALRENRSSSFVPPGRT
jgi:hypothetical protein